MSSINTSYGASAVTNRLLAKDAPREIQLQAQFSISGVLRRRLYGGFHGFHGFHGWRVGALAAAGLALVSFLFNIAVVSWLGSIDQGAGLVEVYKGSCAKVEQFDIRTHLAIML